jgi:DNA-binding beta-propeller fold protein YncE
VWGKPGNDQSSFHTPTGIAVDASGNVFVTDSDNNRIMKFAPIQ